MKKKFNSILLIFALIVSLVPASFISYADTATEEYSSIKGKFSNISYDDASTILNIMNSLLKSEKYTTEIQEAVNELKAKSNGTQALELLKKYNFVNENDYNNCGIEKVLEAISDVQFQEGPYSGKSFAGLAIEFRGYESKSDKEKEDLKADVLKAYEYIYNSCPTEFRNLDFSKYGKTNEDKAKTLITLAKDVFTSGDILVKGNDSKIMFVLPDNYMEEAKKSLNITLSHDDKVYEEAIQVFLDVLSKRINTVGKAKQVKEIAVKLSIFQEANLDGNNGGNNNGGSNSGSGSNSDGSSTDTSTNEKGDTVSEATVSDDAVDVKTVGDKVVASVKKEELSKAVEKALEAKADQTKIKIKLDNVKGLNVEVSLPVQALSKLEGKNANLSIETKELEVNIPVENLDLKDENASIKLDVKELSKDEVKEAKDIKSVAKVVDLSLVTVSEDKTTNIDSKFKTKVKVGINISDVNIDKEKSVVLRLNDNNTEIVGGKIKDGKIYANLDHFSKYAVVERNVTFEDTINHWSKQAVESMASKGIVNGYDENTFNPDKNITRAEFAKLLVNELELDMVNSGSEFNDMNNHWAKDYVNTAYKAGLIKGYDGNFNPNDNITRAQMATMIGRAIDTDNKTDINFFNDSASIPDWSKEDLSKAVGEGFIKGSNGSFRPNDNATRAESTSVIYRMYNK